MYRIMHCNEFDKLIQVGENSGGQTIVSINCHQLTKHKVK